MERQPKGCAQSFQNRIGLEKRKQFMQNRTGECDSCRIGLDWRMPLIAIWSGIARCELVLPAQDANRLPRRGLSSTSTRKVKELGALRLAEGCSSQEWYSEEEKVVVPAALIDTEKWSWKETAFALNAYPSSWTDSAVNKSSLRESTVHSCFGREKVWLVFRLNGDIYNKEYLSQGKQEFPALAKWYRRKVSKFFSLGKDPKCHRFSSWKKGNSILKSGHK